MEPIIRVRNLSKAYRLYSNKQDRLREVLLPWKKKHTLFYALNDISFDVFPGEHLGILGVNGAGKSTLLQVLSGVLVPSAGTVEVHGRIAALLELGAGFNPELTGRENTVFQMEIAGIPPSEIPDMVRESETFADLGDFFDQPVKLYSSGMFARVAFASAITSDPDILIVDEALSVGDARFQRKCFARMQNFRDQGKTILFVTHSDYVVSEFCSRGMLLGGGKILEQGDTQKVIQTYNEIMFGEQGAPARSESLPPSPDPGETWDEFVPMPLPSHAQRFGNRDKAEILNIALLDAEGRPVLEARPDGKYRLQMAIRVLDDMDDCGYSFVIRSVTGVLVFGTHTECSGVKLPPLRKGDIVKAGLDIDMNIVNGDYFVSAGVSQFGLETINQDVWQDALMIHLPLRNDILHQACVDLNHTFAFTVTSKG